MEDTRTAEIMRILEESHGFMRRIRRKKSIRILNIGSRGPERAFRLARAFKRKGISPTVDFLEPGITQRRKLLKLLESDYSRHFGKIHPKMIDDLECRYRYDFIISFQPPGKYWQKGGSAPAVLKKTRELLEGKGAFAPSRPSLGKTTELLFLDSAPPEKGKPGETGKEKALEKKK